MQQLLSNPCNLICRNPVPAYRGCMQPWLERLCQPQGGLLAALGAWRETQSRAAALAQGFALFCTSGSFSPPRENGFWKYISAKQITESPAALQDSGLSSTFSRASPPRKQTQSRPARPQVQTGCTRGGVSRHGQATRAAAGNCPLQTADFFRHDWGKNTAQKQRRVLQGTMKHQIMARAANSRTDL